MRGGILVLILLTVFLIRAHGQPNDNCADATLLQPGDRCVVREYSNLNATAEEISVASNPSCGSYSGADVWFKAVMPASGAIRVEVDNPLSATPPSFTIYSGGCGNFTEVSCARNDDGKTIFNSAIADELIYIRVYRYFSNQGGPFSLCVYEPQIPGNNQCENPQLLEVSQNCSLSTYSNVYATSQPDPIAPEPQCGYYRGGDIWFNVVMPVSGVLHVAKYRVTGATNPVMVAYTGSCGNFTEVFCSSNDATATINNPSLAGQLLYLRIYSYNSEEGANFTLCLYEADAPVNDNCEDAVSLPVGVECVINNYSNKLATAELGVAPQPTCGAYQGGDVWFKVTMPASGALQVETDNQMGAVPPSITFYSGTCGNFKEIDCISNNRMHLVYDQALAAETLFLRFYNFNDDDGTNFELCVFEPGCVADTAHAGEILLCENESYSFGSQTITQPGRYTEVFQTSKGCDSLVSLSVIVNKVNTDVVNDGNTMTSQASYVTYQWINCAQGYAPVAGATGQTFQSTVAGEFAVIITQNSCVDTSACYQTPLVVGIEEDLNQQYTPFPNPVDNLLHIDLHRPNTSFSLELIDMKGRTIKAEDFHQQSLAEIDLRAIPAGAYLLRIQTDQGISIMKVVKE